MEIIYGDSSCKLLVKTAPLMNKCMNVRALFLLSQTHFNVKIFSYKIIFQFYFFVEQKRSNNIIVVCKKKY